MMSETRKGGAAGRGLALLIALGGAIAVAVLLLWALSSSFSEALGLFFAGPFANGYYFGNMLAEVCILVLAGLGASVAFASRNFNLGGEGQVYLGAVATALVCLKLPGGDPVLVPLLAAVASAAAGGLLAWLSGRLRLSLGVDELISSFLLSATVVYLCDFAVTGPLQDPTSNFQSTAAIAEGFRFAAILGPSNLSMAVLPTLAILAFTGLALARTRFGYELTLVGRNAEFARYAGVDTDFYRTAPMAISGALYGLAGSFLVLGSYHRAMKGFSAGLGWTGIAVALVAGNAPLGILPAALLFGYLDAGAKAVMVGADVTQEIVSVIQAAVFFLVTARFAESLLARRKAGRRREGGRGGPG
jgi:simple sugar transport system permease protein